MDGLAEVFRRALRVYGPERVLFGTDSSVFPLGWRRDRLEDQLSLLEACGASADERELVFAGNAARLLGL